MTTNMLLLWMLALQLSCLTMAAIPSSLRSLRREMLGMFQEQEERLDEQERRIARQGETILKMEETIAEQQKTIEVQNEKIQMIAKHPDLRDFLQGFKTEALSPEVLGKFNCSMLTQIL